MEKEKKIIIRQCYYLVNLASLSIREKIVWLIKIDSLKIDLEKNSMNCYLNKKIHCGHVHLENYVKNLMIDYNRFDYNFHW